MSKEVKCRHCGTPNPKDAAFCRNCGKKLKSSSIWRTIGCCFFLLIMVMMLCMMMGLAMDTDKPAAPYNLPVDTTDTVAVVEPDAVAVVATSDTLPTASIDSIWLEHQVTEGGKKGMMVHVKFQTHYMQGREGLVAAYVYNSDGRPLKDTNGRYTAGGYVASHNDIKPKYQHSTFHDRAIFIPYSELHLSSSCEGLYVTCAVFCGETQITPEVKIKGKTFSFTKGD